MVSTKSNRTFVRNFGTGQQHAFQLPKKPSHSPSSRASIQIQQVSDNTHKPATCVGGGALRSDAFTATLLTEVRVGPVRPPSCLGHAPCMG